MISARPPETRSRVAKSWKTRTGSSELSTVTALLRRMFSVRVAAASAPAGEGTAQSGRGGARADVLRGRGGRERRGRRGDGVVRAVVLADAEDVEADRVRQLYLLDEL